LSKSIAFDDVLAWTTRSKAAYFRVIARIIDALAQHREFAPIIAKQEAWESVDHWSFAKVSADSLRAMLRLLDEMLADPAALTAGLPTERLGQECKREVAGLRRVVARRIERIERHNTLRPTWPGIVFGHGIYWEAPEPVMEVVLEHLRTQQSEHSDLRSTFTDYPGAVEGKQKVFRHLSLDGLRVLRRLLDQMQDGSAYTVSGGASPKGVDLLEWIKGLRRVVDERSEELNAEVEATGNSTQ